MRWLLQRRRSSFFWSEDLAEAAAVCISLTVFNPRQLLQRGIDAKDSMCKQLVFDPAAAALDERQRQP